MSQPRHEPGLMAPGAMARLGGHPGLAPATSIKLHGRGDLVLLENQAEALDWLVES